MLDCVWRSLTNAIADGAGDHLETPLRISCLD
jgi:hypothetical protein